MRPYPYDHKKIEVIVHSTKELLLMQSRGKFLTTDEKKRVKEYESEKRQNKTK